MRLDVKKASARGLAIGFATALVSLSTGSAQATSAQTAVAGSGLVAAYSFDEGSGTTVADSSGDGNTGTISNATWTPAGKFGSALSFNGTSSWLTVPDSSSLDLTTAMTLEAWVKPASLSGWDAIVEKEQPGELAYALYANSDTNQPDGIVYINSEQDTRAGGQLPLNSWSHVAATYDGSTLAVYVNGTLVSSRPVTGSIKTSTGMLRIGGDSVWGEYFNGLIDEVRVYNGVLTASAIQADMTTPVNTSASAPANTAAPTISGSTVVGSTLTASTGAWSNSPISYAYEWKRCDGSGASCTAISGATASTYTVGTVDSGSTLGVTVTASNSAGSAQATSAQTAVVGSALVAAYSFDEGSGTTATDASGSGNNGTISGATWSTAGHSGGALSFDGSSSLVTVPDSATLDLGSQVTLEAWVDPSALSTLRRTVVAKNGSGELTYGVYANTGMSSGGGGLSLDGSTETIARGQVQLPLNTWTHLAFAYDGATLTLYENGGPVGTVAAKRGIDLSNGSLQIGGNSVKGEYFAGLIDDVRVYGRALSATQIQTDMNTAVTSTTASPALPPAPGPWVLRFADDFNGSSLDLGKWRPNWLGGSDTTVTKPVNSAELSCYDPAQVSVASGMLTLSAVQRSCTANNGVTYGYASGLVEGRNDFTFTYGYMEARIRVPVNSAGTPVDWPAFWADGTGTWPTTGEIDVMEVLGGGSFCWHFHYSSGAPGGCPSVANPGGWHVFGAAWEPSSITYYYDGVRVGQVTSGVTSATMFLIANLAVSTQHGGPLQVPAHADIDYIRVWQHT